jgi:hypothetical protein
MLSSPTQQEQAEDIDIQINLEEQSLLKLARTSNEVDRVAYWGAKHHQENSLLRANLASRKSNDNL